jgi:hypothetical protein
MRKEGLRATLITITNQNSNPIGKSHQAETRPANTESPNSSRLRGFIRPVRNGERVVINYP